MNLLIKSLTKELFLALEEEIAAESEKGHRLAMDICDSAPEFLIGQMRQAVCQNAFKRAAERAGYEIQNIRLTSSEPSKFSIDLGECGLIAIPDKVGKGWPRRGKSFSRLTRQVIEGQGAKIIDLFSRETVTPDYKPIFAYIPVWKGAKKSDASLPYWTGFSQISGIDDGRVELIGKQWSSADVFDLLDSVQTDHTEMTRVVDRKFNPKSKASSKTDNNERDS